MQMSGETIPSGQSLGGSETCAIQMAEALAKLGQHIVIFCNTEKPHEKNGVFYQPMGWLNHAQGSFPKGFIDYARSTPTDVAVIQRIPGFLSFPLETKVNLLWQHDLATRMGPSNFHGQLWNIDKVMILSEFMKKQYQLVHGGPDHLYELTRNGIDLDLIDSVPTQERDRFKLIYTARPERGLDILLERVFPLILKLEPRAKLYLSRYSDPNVVPMYQQLDQVIQSYGDRVVSLGNLGKQELYKHYKQSRLYIYSSAFEETSPLRGDALIDTPGGRIPIEQLWREQKEDFWIWTYSHTEEKMILGKSHRVIRTRRNAPTVTIRFKWGVGCTANREGSLTLTPDHEVMLRNGTYCRADQLKPGDRVMPFNRTPGWGRFTTLDGVRRKYNLISLNNGERVPEHRYVVEQLLGRPLAKGEVVDHINSDTQNNDPENLRLFGSQADHAAETWARLSADEYADRIRDRSESVRNWQATITKDELHEIRSRAANSRWNKRKQENHVIVSVEQSENADVYCMEVPETHNFVANGILVHNCITSQEVGACGTPFLGPWRGALPETCAGASYLIRDDGSPGRAEDDLEPGFQGVSDAFCKAMAEKAVELMHDDNQWESWSKKARKRAENWTWGPVAEQWVELAHELIAKRSDEPVRMTKHFLVHSDVVAAKKYTEAIGDKSLQLNVQRYIDNYVPFMNESDPEKRRLAIRDFYESRSGGDYANYQTGFYAEGELRLHALIRYLEGHPEVKTLLDFGCAHGGYARVLSNRFPELKVVGADTSPSLVRCGEEMRLSKLPDGSPACLYPQNLAFLVADEDTDIGQTFDCVVAMEVMEHIPHAEEFAQKLERFCKPGGLMVFTVPNGRRERDELVTKGIPPVHVRSFDLHDLRDLFGKRKDYSVASFSDNQEIAWDRSFAGWFMVSYTKDDGKIGEIDWERKFFLQGPRETLSVCMITNNCDETLRRCLKSVEHVADQLIVIDNGPSTDRTVETAMEFGAEVRAGTSPFYCYAHMQVHRRDMIQPGVCDMAGFETPRNESTEGAWADHIMWIDGDEKFTDSSNIYKYLRPNIYYGYAVQQHHLSVDAGKMKVDLPVRIYRNKLGIKFYGIVHEHAELGPDRGMGKYCSAMQDLNISHDGYINEEVRRGRFHRNYNLLQCDRLKHPNRKLGIFLFEVRDNLHMARYTLEQNQGVVTPEVRKYCEAVVRAYKEHFMCQGDLAALAHDGLNYYSEALGILGLGFEVLHSINVSKSGTQPAAHERFRAMDKAEASKLLAFHLDQVAGPIEGPYIA